MIFCSEWLVNQHRDSTASYIGHENLLDYFALVENESKARVKFTLLEVKDHFIEIKVADYKYLWDAHLE